MSLESEFQSSLRNEIEELLPGSIVLKNDPNWLQGIPDLTILYKGKWAFLECKRGEKSVHQDNQDYYIDSFKNYTYTNFIYPENKEVVLDELQRSLKS